MSYTNQTNNDAYANVPTGGQPTYSEAWALIAAAKTLAQSTQEDDLILRKKHMQEALRKNWKLWTIFQAELAVEEECSIPNDIRINMLSLAKFVDNHTVQQLPNPEPERLLVLVDINRNIANGLLEGAKASDENSAQERQPAAAPSSPYSSAEPAAPSQIISGLNEEA